MVVEVDLDDTIFTLVDDGFNSGDLFRWVKGVTFIEVVKGSSLASLPIRKSESNYYILPPLNMYDLQVSEFSQAFVANL